MKFTTLSRRTAAAGAASALVAGALVGATATVAEAAPVQNTYSCTNALIGTFPVVLNSDAPGIENIPGAAAGFTVPGGLLTVTNVFTIPEQVRNALAGAGIENLTFPDFAGDVGPEQIPVEGMALTVSGMTNNGNGTYSSDNTTEDGDPVEGSGLNASFETPAAGTYPVLSPDAFTINADFNGSPQAVACVIAEGTNPGAYHTLVITKNDSTTAAKATNSPVKKGKAAKVAVTVKAPNETPGGQVLLKKGKKTIDKASLNNKGKATLSSKALKVGNNKLKVVYKGDGYTNASNGTVTVKVKR